MPNFAHIFKPAVLIYFLIVFRLLLLLLLLLCLLGYLCLCVSYVFNVLTDLTSLLPAVEHKSRSEVGWGKNRPCVCVCVCVCVCLNRISTWLTYFGVEAARCRFEQASWRSNGFISNPYKFFYRLCRQVRVCSAHSANSGLGVSA
jgi:hypothetical protein